MADQKHSSKSIMYMTIAVAVLLTVVIVPFTIKGNTPSTAGSAEDAEVRIQPVARFELKVAGPADAAASAQPKDGPAVYASVCSACHATGAAGAPVKGDKAAWAPGSLPVAMPSIDPPSAARMPCLPRAAQRICRMTRSRLPLIIW